jgi:hypothetical protein
MMPRYYTLEIPPVVVQDPDLLDFVELTIPTNKVTFLHEVRVTQESDAGDSESAQFRCEIYKGIGSTAGSGGSSLVAADFRKHDFGDADCSITGERGNTTLAIAGGGSLTRLFPEAQNIHNGWLHAPPPNRPVIFSGSQILVVRLGFNAVPALNNVTYLGYLVLEEVG